MAAKPTHEIQTASRLPTRSAKPLPSAHRYAWLLLVSLTATVLLAFACRRGMFWDGVVYATIARNLSAGMGGLWHPAVTDTFMPHFHEHPPLALWMEAALFYVCGDQLWVERAYGMICGMLTAAALVAIWRYLMRADRGSQALAWLAIALWLPCGLWCLIHNMLENTSGMFSAFAVYAALRASATATHWYRWSALAGLAVAAACLCKGPAGAFPLLTPVIAGWTLRETDRRRVFYPQMVFCLCALLPLALCQLYEPARNYLSAYWTDQVLSSLFGAREKVVAFPGRFTILCFLGRDLLPAIGVSSIILLLGRFGQPIGNAAALADGRESNAPSRSGPLWFCLLTAASASFPFLLCPKQTGHYLAPSFGFYSLGLACVCLTSVNRLLPWFSFCEHRRAFRVAGTMTCALACGAFATAWRSAGRACRDVQLIAVADQIARCSQPARVVSVSAASWQSMDENDRLKLHAYLFRYHQVSLTADEEHPAFHREHFRLEPTVRMQTSGPISTFRAGSLDCAARVNNDLASAGLPTAPRTADTRGPTDRSR